MRIISKKQGKRLREYNIVRLLYLDENPICEACDNWPSSEIHHKKGRIGQLLTNAEFFLAVCSDCHREIEMNPEWAKVNGFSLSRLN